MTYEEYAKLRNQGMSHEDIVKSSSGAQSSAAAPVSQPAAQPAQSSMSYQEYAALRNSGLSHEDIAAGKTAAPQPVQTQTPTDTTNLWNMPAYRNALTDTVSKLSGQKKTSGPSARSTTSHSSLPALQKGASFDDISQRDAELDARLKELRKKRDLAVASSGRQFSMSDGSDIKALDEQIKSLEAAQKEVRGRFGGAYNDLFNADDFEAKAAEGAGYKSTADIMHPRETVGLNKVRYAEDNKDAIIAARSDSTALAQRQREYDNLWQMNEDERQMYDYLLASRGDTAADAFLDYIRETLNARAAQQVADSIEADSGISRLARQGAAAMQAGWTGATEGILQNFSSEARPTSQNEFLGQMVQQNIAGHEGGPQVFGRSLESLGFEATQTIANMAPSLAAGMLNPVAGAATIGASSRGQAYKRALDDGYSKEQAAAYSTFVGASEALLQYFLGGIAKLGGISQFTGKATEKIASRGLRAAAELGIDLAGENLEEYLQNKLEPALRNMIFGEDNKITLWDDQDLDTLLVTTLTTALLNSGQTVSTMATGKTGAAIIKSGAQDALIDAAMAQPAGTQSYELASAMKNGTTPVTAVSVGELVTALEAETGKAVETVTKAVAEQRRQSGADEKAEAGSVITLPDGQSTASGQTEALNTEPSQTASLTPAQQVQQMLLQQVSNRTAESMIADPQMRAVLQAMGVKLDGTKSEQRAAVKEAAQEVQSQSGDAYTRLQQLIPALPAPTLTPGTVAPSQQNIDNAASATYTQNEERSNLYGREQQADAGAGLAENPGGVPGVPSGRSGNAESGQRPGRAPGNPGLVLLSQQAQDTLTQSGVYSQMQDVSANGAAFSAALDDARASDAAHGWAVTPKSAEELSEPGVRSCMNEDGTAGFVIAPDGDIEAVFANKAKGAPKGVSRSTIPQAVANGGTKLDCYGEGLVRLYAKHGFVPVAKVIFNPEYANPGWDASKGIPDIYFMMYAGGDVDTLVERYGTFPVPTEAELQALPVMEYDEAYAYRDSLLEQQDKDKTGGPGALVPATETAAAQQQTGQPAVAQNETAIGQNEPLPGQKRSQTESNTESGIAEKLGGKQEPLYYTPITERQTLTEAVNRVQADAVGAMNTLLDKDMWTAADIDTGLTLYGKLMADAVKTGDYTAAQAWSKVVQEHGTRSGQALQAFGKWTRSGVGMAAQAQSLLAETLKQPGTKLTQEGAAKISNDIYQFGEKFDGIEEGDVESLRDLILRQNEYRGTGTFRGDTYENLLDEVNDYDYLREYALRQLMNIAADTTETADLGQKLKTWQVQAQLTRLGTFFRNIGGNVMFGVQDTLTQNGLGVALDMLASKLTGKRTVGLDKSYFSSDVRKAMRKAYVRSVLEVAGDVDMSDGGGKYGTTANRTFKMSDGGFSRFMSRWEQLLGYSLTTSDRVSRGGIEQAITESLKNSGLTEEEIRAVAEGTADYRLFQNKDLAYKISKGLHDVLNILGVGGKVNGVTRSGGFGVGDLINPYPGVPANLAVKALEYSPANIVKGGIEFVQLLKDMKAGEDFDAVKQNRAVMSMARGMAGVPIIALLAAAFKSGVVRNSDDEEDLDVAAQARAEGRTGVQINLDAWLRAMKGGSAKWKDGDDLLSVGWLEPLNAFMAIASMIAGEGGDATLDSMAKDYFSGTLQGVLDMPVMQNIANAIDTFRYSNADNIGERIGDAALSLAGDALSGMLPAPISQAARTIDQSYRDTSADTQLGRVWNSLKNSIPGLRETLPEKQDNFGQPKEYSDSFVQRFFNNFVLPGSVSEMKQSEAAAAVESLYESTGEASVYPDRNAPKSVQYDGEKLKLSTEERQTYHQTYGQLYTDALTTWMNDGTWDGLSETAQVSLLQSLNEYARDTAKRELVESRGGKYESDWDKVAALKDPTSYLAAKASLTEALKAEDYDKLDELLKASGMYQTLYGDAKEALDSGLTSQADKMAVALGYGIGTKNWMEAYEKHKEIDDLDLTASQKATRFYLWARSAGYKPKQQELLERQMGYFSMNRGSTDKIKALTGEGLSDKDAEKIYTAIGQLTPNEGSSSVSQQQKIEAITSAGLSEDATMQALSVYASESFYKKAEAARAAGIGPQDFTALYFAADTNGKSGISQEEWYEAIKDYPAEQRGALWSVMAESEKWKHDFSYYQKHRKG